MRNLKKFLALVLAMMMMLSVAVISTSAADEEADYTDAAQRLAALQVMKGNENGDLMLGNGVTRYQAALFFVQALTGETDAAVWNAEKKSAHFADVPEYGTAIDYAYGINLIKGRGNGVYGYNDAIMYQDMLVMAVRALGYETADMSYPYGYILAAQKLGLTENVDLVNYKAALTRGETAQIIWDMLDTEVAVIDPLTDKVLYPDETGLTDALLGANGQPVAKREKLIKSADLAGDVVTATLGKIDVENEGEEDEFYFVPATYTYVDEDTDAEVEVTVNVAAADLGITEDTAKVTYVGLPVEMYIDVDVAKFAEAYDDEEAAIVFVVAPTYTTVANFGDGNIKFVENENYPEKSYFSFGGAKFAANKYAFAVAEFDNGTWNWGSVTADELAATFAYDADEDVPYVNGLNTFAQVAFRDTGDIVVDDNGTVETDDDVELTIVEVLYTEFEFGQYSVREINEVKYPTITRYEGSEFVERLAGPDDSLKVDDDTEKVTNKKGETALDLTMAGEAVEAGDFMFFDYNEEDNVLTVAKTFGDFETGRLTAKSTAKETVKISGTNYEFGFDGFNPDFDSTWDEYESAIGGYIADLEPGMDNVKYLVVNGKIVYMAACDDDTTSSNEESVFDFAFVSRDLDQIQDLLGLSDAKFADGKVVTDVAGFDSIYVNEDGYMTIAVLNLENGEWEIASLKAVESVWDVEEKEFTKSADVATLASYLDIVGSNYAKKGDYTDALAVVDECLVAVVAVEDGVYTIASRDDYSYMVEDVETAGQNFVGATTTEGLVFFDNNTKTNKITADASEDAVAERVTLDDESVIVFFDSAAKEAGARVGTQGAADSQAVAGEFLAASSKLIVFVSDAFTVDVANDWHDGSATRDLDVVYYVTTPETGAELENVRTEDDDEASYIVTITNLYNLNTNEMVESVQVVVESATDALVSLEGYGALLAAEGDELSIVTANVLADPASMDAFVAAALEIANANEDEIDFFDTVDVNFVADDEIAIPEITGADMMSEGEAVTVEATVITFNTLDAEELDFDTVVLNKAFDETHEYATEYGATDVEFVDEQVYFSFDLDLDEAIAEIDEPTEGIFDNYALAAQNETVLVATADGEDFEEVAINYVVLAAYDEGVVYLTVYRVLTLAD